MCGKNSTTTSTNTPNPQALQTYSTLLNQMGAVAGTPFQPYGGEFVAPVNQQEQLAGSNINANAGYAQPYISQAAQYANNAAQPIGAQQIANYQNPYTQQVVNATEAQMDQQNAVQQSQLTGNASAQGALGNNRVGLAQAALAGQQQLSEAPTIAGLYSQGYGQALQEANTEQQAQAQGAYSLGNLGVAGQNAALTGAGAELGYGQLGQQTQQAQDTALYNQFLAQQGYPFQVTGWEAGLASGLGSQMGGTNVTQGPQPNPLAQYGGLGLSALALLSERDAKTDITKIGELKDGQSVYRYRYKNDPNWQIGLMAGNVERKHPEAVHRMAGFGGMRGIDVKAATDEAAHRDQGGRIANCGRQIAGFAMGGVPYSSLDDDAAAGYIPSVQLQPGNTMPKGPSGSGQQQQTNPIQQANSILGLQKAGQNFGSTPLGQSFGMGSPSTSDAQLAGLQSGLSPEEVGLGDAGAFRRGGSIAGFAGGGSPDMDYAEGGGPGDQQYQLASLTGSPDMPVISPEMLPSASPAAGLAGPSYTPDLAGTPAVQPPAPNTDYAPSSAPMPPLGGFNGNMGGGESEAGYSSGASKPNAFLASPVATSGGDLSAGKGMPSLDAAAHAIGMVESGGSKNPYSEVGPPTRNGDVALGRWQVMSHNLPEFLKQAGLPPMSAADFLRDPQAQRQVFDTVFGGYMQKYGNFNDATSAWFSGRPMSAAGNASDGYTTVPQYVAAANRALPGGGGQDAQTAGVGSSAMAFAPTGGQASAAPLGPDQQAKSGMGGFNPFGLSDNVRTGLLAAGLGMAASRSPYLGNAIGEGGLAGLQAYEGQKKEAFNEDLAHKKLDQQADAIRQRIAHEAKQEQHSQDQIDIARQRLGLEKEKMDPEYASKMAAARKGLTSLPQEAWDKTGDEFLQYIPREQQNAVKGLADYTLSPKDFSGLGQRREQVENWAKQYDPSFDSKVYNQRYNAMSKWATGPQGQNLTSVNTSINHLDTTLEAAENLGSSDVRLANRAKNFFATEFGKSNVTTFEGVRDIVADELVKSILGTAGSDDDRKIMRARLSAASSAPQLRDMVEGYKKLMAGRLDSMERNYTETTGLSHESFVRRLSPHTQQMYNAYRPVAQEPTLGAPGAATGAPTGGRTLTAQDQQALQWANANPQDPRAAQIKQRLGVQ